MLRKSEAKNYIPSSFKDVHHAGGSTWPSKNMEMIVYTVIPFEHLGT